MSARMEAKQTELKLIEGEIVVDDAWVLRRCDELATVAISCASKYPEVVLSSAQLCLYNAGVSLHTDDTKKGKLTTIEFAEFPDWEIFTAVPGRYDILVTLQKIEKTCHKDVEQ
jgi:hypothetical protein